MTHQVRAQRHAQVGVEGLQGLYVLAFVPSDALVHALMDGRAHESLSTMISDSNNTIPPGYNINQPLLTVCSKGHDVEVDRSPAEMAVPVLGALGEAIRDADRDRICDLGGEVFETLADVYAALALVDDADPSSCRKYSLDE